MDLHQILISAVKEVNLWNMVSEVGGGESVEGSPACNVRSPEGRSEGRSPQEPRGKCKCPGGAQTRPEGLCSGCFRRRGQKGLQSRDVRGLESHGRIMRFFKWELLEGLVQGKSVFVPCCAWLMGPGLGSCSRG